MTAQTFRIAVLPGDGIGIEVMDPCLALLRAVSDDIGGFDLEFEMLEAGAGAYRDTGTALPEATLEAARGADAILLGAMGLPDIRYPDGTEIAPQIDLRGLLGLYAGVRPMRKVKGIPSPLADTRAEEIDFVLIRESTEGLFYSHGKGEVEGDREARETMVITRDTSERLFRFAFRLAGGARRAARRAVSPASTRPMCSPPSPSSARSSTRPRPHIRTSPGITPMSTPPRSTSCAGPGTTT